MANRRSGIAQSMPQIIFGRVLGGIGAAAMSVLVSVIITDLVPLIQVASWRSFVNVVATLGRSIGGPLGGLLADTIGWRWSFIGQGPLLIAATILIAFKLPHFAVPEEHNPKGHPSKLRRVDFVGAILLAATITALLGSLSIGGQSSPWDHPIVIGPIIASVVLGSVFVFYEQIHAFEPIFPPALVVQRDVGTSYLIQALQTAAQVGVSLKSPPNPSTRNINSRSDDVLRTPLLPRHSIHIQHRSRSSSLPRRRRKHLRCPNRRIHNSKNRPISQSLHHSIDYLFV